MSGSSACLCVRNRTPSFFSVLDHPSPTLHGSPPRNFIYRRSFSVGASFRLSQLFYFFFLSFNPPSVRPFSPPESWSSVAPRSGVSHDSIVEAHSRVSSWPFPTTYSSVPFFCFVFLLVNIVLRNPTCARSPQLRFRFLL